MSDQKTSIDPQHISDGHQALSAALRQAINAFDKFLTEIDTRGVPVETRALSRVIRAFIEEHLPQEGQLISHLLGPAHPAYYALVQALDNLHRQSQYLKKMLERDASTVEHVVLQRQSRRVLNALTTHREIFEAKLPQLH